jgi:hypothetical protein
VSEVSNLCRLAGRDCASILTARDVSFEADNVGDVAFSWWLCDASTAAFATHRSTQYLPGMPKHSFKELFDLHFSDWKPVFE